MRAFYQVPVFLACVSAALVFGFASARAAETCDVTLAERAVVAAIVDGSTFALGDGRRVRLAAIQAPRIAPQAESDWPLAQTAKENLSSLILNRTVGLGFAEKGTDRHGDLLAQVYLDNGDWLQSALIASGLARVQTRADMRRCARALLAAEDDARSAKRGIWADPFYRVRSADGLEDDIGTFQIVEGKVLKVTETRDRTFVNFGADYRTDFTIAISARDRKRLNSEGVDPVSWAGKKLRVRGWLSLLNGPELELTHAEQIERLD